MPSPSTMAALPAGAQASITTPGKVAKKQALEKIAENQPALDETQRDLSLTPLAKKSLFQAARTVYIPTSLIPI